MTFVTTKKIFTFFIHFSPGAKAKAIFIKCLCDALINATTAAYKAGAQGYYQIKSMCWNDKTIILNRSSESSPFHYRLCYGY